MMELNKIYNMDCLEGMRQMPDNSVDLIVTSLPYNQNLTTQDTTKKLYKDNLSEEEYNNLIYTLFKEAYRLLKSDGSFYYNYKSNTQNNLTVPAYIHLLKFIQNFKIAGEIIWKYAGNFDSNKTRFPIDYEMIFHLVKNKDFKFFHRNKQLSSVWQIKHVMAGSAEKIECKSHPCPYPINLIKKIIEHSTNEGDTILDPFMGSGTTAVACKQLNRNFIGFEISPEYCKIANKRLSQESLFTAIDNQTKLV